MAMNSTIARRKSAQGASAAQPQRKQTAYGRALWRTLKEMQKAGPWEFGPPVRERVFRKQ